MANNRGVLYSTGSDDEYLEDDDEEEWSKWRSKSCQLDTSNSSSNFTPARKRQKLDSFYSSNFNSSSSTRWTDTKTQDPPKDIDNQQHDRVIVHIDIDCFYAQVEMILNPTLRGRPLGIQQKHILVTCNYVAREKGLKKLITLAEAKKTCPELIIINGEDLTKYRDFSSKVTKLLLTFAPKVERLGLDENFIDVTELVKSRLVQGGADHCQGGHDDQMISQPVGCVYGFDDNKPCDKKACPCGCQPHLVLGSVIAAELRKAILDQIGLTTCAGIAHNKLLAKIAGEQNKPNKQTLLLPLMSDELMKSLQARKIPGIGSSTSSRLQALGVSSCGDLQSCSWQVLQSEFGAQTATLLLKLSRGEDNTEVSLNTTPKSISEEDSYQNCFSMDSVKANLRVLVGNLMPRLTDDLGIPRTVRLSIRRGEQAPGIYKKESRQCATPTLLNSNSLNAEEKTEVLFGVVLELFHKLVNSKKPFQVRVLNVCLTNFEKHSQKRSLKDLLVVSDSKKGDPHTSCTKTIGSTFDNAVKQTPLDIQTPLVESKNDVLVLSDYGRKEGFSDLCEQAFKVDMQQRSLPHAKPTSSAEEEKTKIMHCSTGEYDFSECLPAASNLVPSKTLSIGTNNEDQIPKHVDLEVFHSLPEDVKADLKQQWKREANNRLQGKKSSKPPPKPSGLLKYFSKT